MTTTSITAPGLSGVLRMTWVHDDLAHVLEHADTDEPSGTWTGLACPDHGLALGGDVDNATLRRLAADGKIADLVWEAPEELAAEHGQAFQSAMQAYQHWTFRVGRAALAGVADNLVAGLGGELRGARAATERGDHDVLAGQTAALGHRLLRAPLRPSRPSAPACPQHRHHPADNGDSS